VLNFIADCAKTYRSNALLAPVTWSSSLFQPSPLHHFGVRQCCRHVSRNAVGMAPDVTQIFQHCSFLNVFTCSGIHRVVLSFYRRHVNKPPSLVSVLPNFDLPGWETRSGVLTVNIVKAISLTCRMREHAHAHTYKHTQFPESNLLLCQLCLGYFSTNSLQPLKLNKSVWKRVWIQ
jgi:hypothetical protein